MFSNCLGIEWKITLIVLTSTLVLYVHIVNRLEDAPASQNNFYFVPKSHSAIFIFKPGYFSETGCD